MAYYKFIRQHLLLLIVTFLAYILINCITSTDAKIYFTANANKLRQGSNLTLICTDQDEKDVEFLQIELRKAKDRQATIQPTKRHNSSSIIAKNINTNTLNGNYTYDCLFRGTSQVHQIITVYRKLKVSSFDCFITTAYESQIECEITLPYNLNLETYTYRLQRDEPFPDEFPMDCVYGNTTISCHFGPVEQGGHNLNIEFDYRFTLYMKDPLSTTQLSFNISKQAMVILPGAQVESIRPGPNEICFDVRGDYFNDIYKDWPVEWHFSVKNESNKLVDFTQNGCKPIGILYSIMETHKCCLGQLQGYRKYEINFSRKFNGSSIAHWANTTISNRTTCDIPSKSPYMESNWFEYDHNTLRLYWVHLDEDQQNCNNVTYEITKDNKSLKADYIDLNSATIMDWQENWIQNINVKSKNVIGVSVNGSSVSVPKLSDGSKREQLKVVYNMSTHIVTWTFNDQSLNSTDLTGFTILWCHLGNGNARCKATESIQFTKVNRTQYSYNFRPLESQRQITVAVSANFENPRKSGGLYWDKESPQTTNKPFSIVPYLMASALSLTFASSGYYAYTKLKKRSQISVDIQQDLETPVAEWLRNKCDNQSNGTLNILSSLCRVIWLRTFATMRNTEVSTVNNRENEELIASDKATAIVRNEATDVLEMTANPVSDTNNQSGGVDCETIPDPNSSDDPPNNPSPLAVPGILVDSKNHLNTRSGKQSLGVNNRRDLSVSHPNNQSEVIVCETIPDPNSSDDPSNNPVPGILVDSENYLDNRSGILNLGANNRRDLPVSHPNNQSEVIVCETIPDPNSSDDPPNNPSPLAFHNRSGMQSLGSNNQSRVPVRNVNPPNNQNGLVTGSGYVDCSIISIKIR